MGLTVIIPFFNGPSLSPLLRSLPSEWDILVVNDQSDYPPEIAGFRNTFDLNLNKKGYFTGAVNAGIRACDTDVLIVNQDIVFTNDKPFKLIIENSDKYGMIGERIAGEHPAWPNGYIHGTFMYVRRDVIDKIGLMNEKYYPLWGSTCEWQLRACRKNFRVLPTRPIKGMQHQRKGNYGSSIKEILKREPGNRSLLIRTPPLISVIVPCYNHGKFLPELVASLIGGKTVEGIVSGQTLQSFELIISDDCSTDDTAEIAKSLADPWKGIHYVRTPKNGGTSLACNTAIGASNSSIIARIDGDDMREPHSLEELYDLLQDNPHSFVYDDAIVLTPAGRQSKPWRIQEYDFNKLICKNQVHAGIMFPKKAWEEAGRYPEAMRWGRDDWAFNVALGSKGYHGVHLRKPGYIYRRHGNNRTIRNTTPRHREFFFDQLRKLFPQIYTQEIVEMCCGNGRAIPRSQTTVATTGGYKMSTLTEGSEGMILLEYQEGNFGNTTFYGPATGRPYVFSAKKKRRYVDARDVHFTTPGGRETGLLDLTSKGKDVFRAVSPPKKVVEPVKKEVEPEQVKVAEEVPSIQVVEETSNEETIDDFTLLDGVGKKTAEKLLEAGFDSIVQLVDLSEAELIDKINCSFTTAMKIKRSALEWTEQLN